MKTLDFSLVSESVPVTLRTETAVLELELRQLLAKDRDSYMDSLSERMRMDGEGKPCGIKKYKGLQADLLALCLFHKDSKAAVTKEEVQLWPAKVVSELFDSAQELNLLNKRDEAEIAGAIKNA